jgi:uncharacterized membrane protein (UPF0182 family)
MSQTPRRTAIRYVVTIGAFLALFVIFTSTVGIYTDWLWFASLGQLGAYQTRLWTRVGLWFVAAVSVILVLIVNWFLIPRRLLGQLQVNLRGRGW